MANHLTCHRHLLKIPLLLTLQLLVGVMLIPPVQALDTPTAVALADHSKDVASLFNNMRTPAALLTGGLVPLGILSAQPIDEENDSRGTKLIKQANVVLAVTSLLSEIIAVIYSSIAINKLVEVPSPPTAGVAELISQHYELSWLGTNIHFLIGMMGFILLVGNRTYLMFGQTLGKFAIGLSVASFLQALHVVNKGIAMGSINKSCVQTQFATNFFKLCLRYVKIAIQNVHGFCGIAAMVITFATVVATMYSFLATSKEAIAPAVEQKTRKLF